MGEHQIDLVREGEGPLALERLVANESIGDFDNAAQDALATLHERLGFGLWMVTRVVGDDWIVLASEDHGYGIGPGTLLRWSDSFCQHMVRGEGPVIAPRADDVEVYRDARIGRQVPIGAYVGAPIRLPTGELFGTLCAIDPDPQPDELVRETEYVLLVARLLASVLHNELRAVKASRDAELARAEATTDPLTGLPNRRAWDAIVPIEDARCDRYGAPAAMLSIDLDGLKETNDAHGHEAGDDLLRETAAALRQTARSADLVARLGGDEFAVLATDSTIDDARQLRTRVAEALAERGIEASIGLAARRSGPSGSLDQTLIAADRAMYADKRARSALRRAEGASA